MRRTKIVATLGPSSLKLISQLSKFVDVFRVNFAHGDENSRREYVRLIREEAPESSILIDLPGPKLRVGDIGRMELKRGQEVLLSPKGGITVEDPVFYSSVKEGSVILISDGLIRIKVTNVSEDEVRGVVLDEGVLTSRKGINIPDLNLRSGLTQRDLELLEEAISLKADYVGLSFVLSAEDVRKAKERIKGRAWVVSKIEKRQAVENLKQIILESDAVMVARGDLGVEIGLENLPYVQRKIISTSKTLGRPVILATQVLESMVLNPMPWRAEVIDVANSVYQGVDAIMLSDETASGSYPLEAVRYLHRIITSSEDKVRSTRPTPSGPDDAVASASLALAETSKSKLIVVHTRSGLTALRVSRLRPRSPILCLTPDPEVARRLRLCWGITTVVVKGPSSLDEMVSLAVEHCRRLGVKGSVVIVAGDPSTEPGRTDFIKLHNLDEEKGLKSTKEI